MSIFRFFLRRFHSIFARDKKPPSFPCVVVVASIAFYCFLFLFRFKTRISIRFSGNNSIEINQYVWLCVYSNFNMIYRLISIEALISNDFCLHCSVLVGQPRLRFAVDRSGAACFLFQSKDLKQVIQFQGFDGSIELSWWSFVWPVFNERNGNATEQAMTHRPCKQYYITLNGLGRI